MEKKDIVDRIEEVRERSGLNISEFADLLGMTRGGLGHVLKRRNAVSKRVIDRVCYVFNVRHDWLVHGKGDPYVELDNMEFSTKPTPADIARHTIQDTIKKLSDDDVLMVMKLINMISESNKTIISKEYPGKTDSYESSEMDKSDY